MKKRLAYILAIVLAAMLIPTGVFAEGSTVTSKTYNEVIKSGKYAYCIAYKGIYKVKLKNNKPVSKKRIVKASKKYGECNMIKKGKYIYFLRDAGADTRQLICRVKTSGGKVQKLASMDGMGEYAISGNKIYYIDKFDVDSTGLITKTYCMEMNLDGSAKKETTVEPEMKYKSTNKKGFRVKYKMSGKKIVHYLKTPKGKLNLCKF